VQEEESTDSMESERVKKKKHRKVTIGGKRERIYPRRKGEGRLYWSNWTGKKGIHWGPLARWRSDGRAILKGKKPPMSMGGHKSPLDEEITSLEFGGVKNSDRENETRSERGDQTPASSPILPSNRETFAKRRERKGNRCILYGKKPKERGGQPWDRLR